MCTYSLTFLVNKVGLVYGTFLDFDLTKPLRRKCESRNPNACQFFSMFAQDEHSPTSQSSYDARTSISQMQHKTV